MKGNFDTKILKNLVKNGADKEFLEHLLSSLLNTFPDHIYLKDRQSRFILINESMLTLFKVNNQDEVLGKTDFDFFSKEHAQAAFDDEQEIMNSGIGRSNFVEKETWDDGSVTWVASTKVPFFDENRNIIGLFGISRDITARKKAEIEISNRSKELDCFIEISKIVKKKDLTLEGHIKKIASLIPSYLDHAYICSVRIIMGNKAVKCSNFRETEFMKKFRIKENNTKIGEMEIYTSEYIRKFPDTTDQVLKLIAARIAEILEKKWIEKDIRKWEHILKDAENHMDLYP